MKTDFDLQEIVNLNLEKLFEDAPCAFLITTPNGLLLKANRTFFDWLGRDYDELINKVHFQQLLSIGSKIYYETHYAPLLRIQGELSEITVDLKAKDDSLIPVLISTKAVSDEEGRFLFYKSTLFNISDRRKYEKELLSSRIKAEKESIRVNLLFKAGEELSKSYDHREVLPLIANHATEKFCDAFVVDLLLEAGLQRVAESYTSKDRKMPIFQMRPEFTKSILISDIEKEVPEYLEEIFFEAEPQSIIIVPIIKNNEVVGIVSALITELGRRFDENDCHVLMDLSERICTALDLNELHSINKRVSQEISQAKGWLQSTLKFIQDGVIGIELDGTISFINEEALKLTGWELKEVVGKPVDEVLNVDMGLLKLSLPAIIEKVFETRISSKRFKGHYLFSRIGQSTLIEHSTSPIIDHSGNLLGAVIIFRDVTEEHEQHKRLFEERSRLEAVLQQMPEGVLIADPAGKVVLKNSQLDILLNSLVDPGEQVEFELYQGFKTNGNPYLPHEWPLARSLRQGEVIINEEVTIIDKSNNNVTLSVSSSPIRNIDGSVEAAVLVLHNITEAKKTEADLRYQLALTKVITDNAPSALFMMDEEGKPTYMNPAAKNLTGYSSLEEISEKPLHYAIHWKKTDGSHYPMEECPIDNAHAALKDVQNQEELFCTKEGRLFPVSYSVAPIEKDGKVFGSVLEFRDISEQKEIEGRLKEAITERDHSVETLKIINNVGKRLTAELDLEKLVQQITDDGTRLTGAQFGAFFFNSTDDQGHTLLLNVVSGVPKEEFSKFPNPRATEIFHPTFVGAGTVRSDDITKDHRYGKNAPHHCLPQGHLPVRSYLAVSVTSRTGEVIGGLVFGHEKPGMFSIHSEEIAEGIATQASVAMDNARLYSRLKDSVRARDEFLSIASHELKTPLTSLKLQTQIRNRKLLKNDINLFSADALKKMFDTDARQIERLNRLIDDMLDISRISTGKLTLQLETFDMCSLAKDVLDRFSTQMQEAGTEISIDCQGKAEGTWDKFRIEQVITNLLTNAIRYGNQKPIGVKVKTDSGNAIIEVQDRGIGIAEENQKRIFERFERAISPNEISGLGLGLYIVKQIIDMHNGSIEVKSKIGQGSTFIVQLPMKRRDIIE